MIRTGSKCLYPEITDRSAATDSLFAGDSEEEDDEKEEEDDKKKDAEEDTEGDGYSE